MHIEQRLSELGIELMPAAAPIAMYVPVRRMGNALFVSGQVPQRGSDGEHVHTGKVGKTRDIAFGQAAARSCILNMLAALKGYLGDLDAIANIIKIQGFVNSEDDFDKPYLVLNAASELLFDVFGEAGRHARTAVGVNVLPNNVTVEIEAVIELKPE